jgi:hypothetical protein
VLRVPTFELCLGWLQEWYSRLRECFRSLGFEQGLLGEIMSLN